MAQLEKGTPAYKAGLVAGYDIGYEDGYNDGEYGLDKYTTYAGKDKTKQQISQELQESDEVAYSGYTVRDVLRCVLTLFAVGASVIITLLLLINILN